MNVNRRILSATGVLRRKSLQKLLKMKGICIQMKKECLNDTGKEKRFLIQKVANH